MKVGGRGEVNEEYKDVEEGGMIRTRVRSTRVWKGRAG